MDVFSVHSLHYTMAVLTEVERMNPTIATPAPHRCVKDTNFGGYFIPKVSFSSSVLRLAEQTMSMHSKYHQKIMPMHQF